MLATHAVGIDLGTTYSCIAYLNEHGEPVTLPNEEGELATPSVVLFDGDSVIVGTEALRNSIVLPTHVVQNSKRYIGDPNHRWTIDGKPYTPVDIATFVLKKLLSSAQEQIGPIEQAVITVPAQFSDFQRHATLEAGHRAGLQRVDIINEPIAAALCYVLGNEGLWFTELAGEQRIMVYDLGGGTFDLSVVRYQKNEVSVIASSGDLNLGGIDWNHALEQAICNQFAKEFQEDPRTDPESLQFLALEAEQAKRSLTVRPRAALTCQHAGLRKTYQVEQTQFEKLTTRLVDRTSDVTKRLLKDNKMGWAHVDVVLTTGGASRMPMIRNKLKQLSGTTLNTALSPDQSIAHGATYYAGMLLTDSKFAKSIMNQEAISRLSQIRQRSVNARGLGILVRDTKAGTRFPHYLIAANTPLPASATQDFGTVVVNQRRVHLQIIESGTSPDQPPVKLGACIVEDLPPNLPEGSAIAVTISYDAQARVHVSAKDVTSGKQAGTEIVRQENLVPQLESKWKDEEDAELAIIPPPAEKAKSKPGQPETAATPETIPQTVPQKKPSRRPPAKPKAVPSPPATRGLEGPNGRLEGASQPIPLCNECGEALDVRGNCPHCGPAPPPKKKPAAPAPQPVRKSKSQRQVRPRKKVESGPPAPRAVPKPVPPARNAAKRQSTMPPPIDENEILELDDNEVADSAAKKKPAAKRSPKKKRPQVRQRSRKAKKSGAQDPGEDEFWQLVE